MVWKQRLPDVLQVLPGRLHSSPPLNWCLIFIHQCWLPELHRALGCPPCGDIATLATVKWPCRGSCQGRQAPDSQDSALSSVRSLTGVSLNFVTPLDHPEVLLQKCCMANCSVNLSLCTCAEQVERKYNEHISPFSGLSDGQLVRIQNPILHCWWKVGTVRGCGKSRDYQLCPPSDRG